MNETLKARIRRREVTIGSWLNLGNAAVAEIMCDAGFEWLVVDLEHSPTSLREAEAIIRVTDLKGVVPFVRVSANDPVQIKRVLDAGAQGIIVPMINSKAEAEAAVASVKYPPEGWRGFGIGRAHSYGPGFDKYVAAANDRTIVIAQIEHHLAIENLAAIQSVGGIDGTIIGPYDLSGSVGKPGRSEDPQVMKLLERYETASKAASRVMGVHVVPPDHTVVRDKIGRGYTFIALSVDFLFLGESCRRELRGCRDAANPR